VFGVGPIQQSPLGMLWASKMATIDGQRWYARVDAAVQQLNQQLQGIVTQINADNALGMEHKSLQLVFANVYGAIVDISKYPAKYGELKLKPLNAPTSIFWTMNRGLASTVLAN